jgi:hypothetical protein
MEKKKGALSVEQTPPAMVGVVSRSKPAVVAVTRVVGVRAMEPALAGPQVKVLGAVIAGGTGVGVGAGMGVCAWAATATARRDKGRMRGMWVL